jgi:DNA primase
MHKATPLSEYFFAELGRDVELGSLDGRARLAERARPLIARLPDGAFRDLMGVELERRTGAKATFQPEGRARSPHQRTAPVQRSLVRTAITLLIAQPGLADLVERPYAFLALDKPGVGLLAELIDLARSRPGINPATLVEQFAGREEHASLDKLARADVVGEPEMQKVEFLDALMQMQHQGVVQRRQVLQEKMRAGRLEDAEKAELRELLTARPPRSIAGE